MVTDTATPVVYENVAEYMGHETKTTELLKNEIPGCTVFNHTIMKGDSIPVLPDSGGYHILTLVTGTAAFIMDGATYQFSIRTTFIPGVEQDLTIKAETDAQILEVFWKLLDVDLEEIRKTPNVFPKFQIYRDCLQYTDSAKTEKTINRLIIEPHNIPRFAMGSVESFGPDLVKQHPHPMIDQFFYSFPENDMDCLINDDRINMKGNILLHIPLGSNHGVDVRDGQRMHYCWIDFWSKDMPDMAEKLKVGHVKTGKMRDFTKEGYKKDFE